MSLKSKINKLISLRSQKLGARLSLAFLAIYLLSSAILFTLLYFVLAHLLEGKDQEIIEAASRRYANAYETGGFSALKEEVQNNTSQKESSQLLVRLQRHQMAGALLAVPDDFQQYLPDEVERKLTFESKNDRLSPWLDLVSPQDSEDVIEVRQTRLKDQSILQVGKNTEDREDLLDHFRRAFLFTMIPGIALGILAAIIFSRRWLKPIRELVRTIRALEAGTSKTRAAQSASNDELADLTRIFNSMLDRNEHLIQGFRDSLDFVAHDLRTPMTRFRSIAETALMAKEFELSQEALGEAMEASEDILKLLNMIMDISEADAGAINLHLVEVDIGDLLISVQDLYQFVAEDRGVKIIVSRPENLKVSADHRIKQAVANLVDNAVKFSARGGIVHLTAMADTDRVTIEVEDKGVGIRHAEVGKIWDRLYRSDASRSTPGSGLGLSLVKSIVKAHGGEVSVISEPNQGSKFKIVLPRRKI